MLALRSLAVFALVIALTALGTAPSNAAHSWSTYHWGRTANPFTLQLGDNVSGDWDGHLVTASADWSSTAYDGQTDPQTGVVVENPIRTTVTAGGSMPRKCRPTSGRIEVCNATYGNNGWLGLAQIWLSGGHIVQGVAKMNDTYFKLSTYNNPNEKLHVMCQEVGHAFGLGHQDESGISLDTCMDYFSNTGANAGSTVSTRPNLHDYGQLTAKYVVGKGGHLDSTNTFKGTGAANANGGGLVNAPGLQEDGTPAGASRSRGDVYITRIGPDHFIVTFITWAR